MLLSIETATPVCSVALHEKGELVGYSEGFIEKSHSEVLTLMIRNLLEQTKHRFENLTAVAISQGPGSYTGLRIGTSTAKGVCYALDIPLLAVDTLLSLSTELRENQKEEKILFCPMLDARRMEVYTALHNTDLEVIRPTEAHILTEKSFEKELQNHKIHFMGDGASKFQAICSHPHAIFWENRYPSAKFIGKLASKYSQKNQVDIAYFEPFYLKEFFTKPAKKIALGKDLTKK